MQSISLRDRPIFGMGYFISASVKMNRELDVPTARACHDRAFTEVIREVFNGNTTVRVYPCILSGRQRLGFRRGSKLRSRIARLTNFFQGHFRLVGAAAMNTHMIVQPRKPTKFLVSQPLPRTIRVPSGSESHCSPAS